MRGMSKAAKRKRDARLLRARRRRKVKGYPKKSNRFGKLFDYPSAQLNVPFKWKLLEELHAA